MTHIFAHHLTQNPQRQSVEHRLRWVLNAKSSRWQCTFQFIRCDFICVGSRFSVEYGLNTPDPQKATLTTFGWYVTNVLQMLWMQAHSSLESVDVPTRQQSGVLTPQPHLLIDARNLLVNRSVGRNFSTGDRLFALISSLTLYMGNV